MFEINVEKEDTNPQGNNKDSGLQPAKSLSEPANKNQRVFILGITNLKEGAFSSITSLTNIMLASSLLVMPIGYRNGGILSSIFASTIIGLISYKTCSILMKHFRFEEYDISETIKRGLGSVWHTIFVLASFFYLSMLATSLILIANSLFINSILSYITTNLLNKTMDNDTEHFIAAGLFFFIFLLSLLNAKNLFSKFHWIGLFTVLILLGFIFFFAARTFIIRPLTVKQFSFIKAYLFIRNGDYQVNLGSIRVFQVIGVFTLSFFVHTQASTILKYCKQPEKKALYLRVSYILVGSLYAIIGTFGYIATICPPINSADPDPYCYYNSTATTIMDFFYPKIGAFVMSILFLIQIISTLPTIIHVCRANFFSLFYKLREPNKLLLIVFDFLFISVVYGLSYLKLEPQDIQAYDGAFCGFFLIYLIPILLHLNILYKKRRTRTDDLIEPFRGKNIGASDDESSAFEQGHDQDIKYFEFYKVSKTKRYIFYSLLMIFGILIFAINIYVVLDSFNLIQNSVFSLKKLLDSCYYFKKQNYLIFEINFEEILNKVPISSTIESYHQFKKLELFSSIEGGY